MRYVFTCVALLIVLSLSYGNSFDCSWHFDDEDNITQNRNIRLEPFTWDHIQKISHGFRDEGKISRPVAYISFAVNYFFGGLNVFGYHLINFLIHYFSSVFLFLFIFNTLKLPLLKEKYEKHAYSIALLSTMFWAISPVHVTAITYIVQRMASMAGLFYIMSMYFYLKFRTSPSAIKYIHIVSCLIFAALAVGTKENAVMLPLSIFLYDLFIIQGLTKDNIKKNIKIVVIPLIIIIAIGFLFVDATSILNGYGIRPFTMKERLLTEPRIILFYISLLFYPLTSRLTFLHDIEISKSLLDPWTTLVAILLILFILTISLVKAKKWPLFAYCIVFFFINHIVEGSFISLELIYEHRNYVPSMLLFVPLAVGLVNCLEYFLHRKVIFYLLATAITLLIIVLSVAVYMQNNIMRNELSLWSDNVRKSPFLHGPHQNLAVAFLRSGRFHEALDELEKAHKSFNSANIVNKDTTYRTLGDYYYITGHDDKALEYYKKSIVSYWTNSKTAYAFNRIAVILIKKGKLSEAERMIKEAIDITPSEAMFYETYSEILNKNNQPEAAIKQAQKALRLNPDSFLAYRHIAGAYKIKNNKKSEQHFLKISHIIENRT